MTNPEGLTIETLIEIARAIPKDPLAEWMRSKGFDPDKGCMMLVPPGVYYEMQQRYPRGKFFRGIPDYIDQHPYIHTPILVNAETGRAIRSARGK